MKGKNKHRYHDRDIFWMDSEDAYSDGPVYGCSAPGTSYEEYAIASYLGGSKGGPLNSAKDTLKPRNPRQELYVKSLENDAFPIIISTGPAGCGKSLWACVTGVRMLQKGLVSKIILTRPAVSVDEEHGFLPGSLEEKMDPWIRPLYDVLYKYYSPKQISSMIEKQVIEICPLAYMRGRTFENSWIILDEAQNTLQSQMLMMLTRIGKGSKLIVTGDPAQHDRGFETNGLSDLLTRISKRPQADIAVVRFEDTDIERHPVIQKVLHLYKD
jgi:phosphate starvation-inducible PhoH-like protein